jgi:hypothetical protein
VWVCSPSAFLLGWSLTLLSLAFLVVSCVIPIQLLAPSLLHLHGGCHSAPLASCHYHHGWWCCCCHSYCAPGCRSFCSPAFGKVISAHNIKRMNNSQVGPGGDTSLRHDSGTGNTVCFRLWVCSGTGTGLDFHTRGKTVPMPTVLRVSRYRSDGHMFYQMTLLINVNNNNNNDNSYQHAPSF